MEQNYNPGSEDIKPDVKKAKSVLINLKRKLEPKKFIYKLESGAFVESDKTQEQIERIYKQKVIEKAKWNEPKHY